MWRAPSEREMCWRSWSPKEKPGGCDRVRGGTRSLKVPPRSWSSCERDYFDASNLLKSELLKWGKKSCCLSLDTVTVFIFIFVIFCFAGPTGTVRCEAEDTIPFNAISLFQKFWNKDVCSDGSVVLCDWCQKWESKNWCKGECWGHGWTKLKYSVYEITGFF